MSNIAQADVIAVIEKALEKKPGMIGENTRAQEIDNWDSLGHLSVLVALNKLFDGKIVKIGEMAEADSIPKILNVLRHHALLS